MPRYRFSEFIVSPRRRLLVRRGRERPLIPRYFDLLVFLIERRHEAVPRQDIFDHVWRDVIVSDSALSQAIRTLRRALVRTRASRASSARCRVTAISSRSRRSSRKTMTTWSCSTHLARPGPLHCDGRTRRSAVAWQGWRPAPLVARMSAEELERGYWRAYREFYRWGSIARGATAHEDVVAGLRHVACAAGWKKFEPLWDAVIRARRAGMMLPLLETILSELGRRTNAAERQSRNDETIVRHSSSRSPRATGLPA